MNLTVSSNRLGNPYLVELLEKLADSFSRMGRDFFVIGATARDIVVQQLLDMSSRRKTRDLDLAIAITSWEDFDDVRDALIADGFEKDRSKHQRFYYDEYEIDIVPYGYVAKEDDNIYWPPEETIAMSVKGFDEVLREAITIDIDGRFSVKIASLHGLFLLKFNAWLDRHLATNKDAEDMSFILSNYLMANVDRETYMEVYDWDDFDEYVAGAYWLAHDLAELLTPDQLNYYADQIVSELQKEEQSHLLNQMLDSQAGLTYDQLRCAWEKIVGVFRSAK